MWVKLCTGVWSIVLKSLFQNWLTFTLESHFCLPVKNKYCHVTFYMQNVPFWHLWWTNIIIILIKNTHSYRLSHIRTGPHLHLKNPPWRIFLQFLFLSSCSFCLYQGTLWMRWIEGSTFHSVPLWLVGRILVDHSCS